MDKNGILMRPSRAIFFGAVNTGLILMLLMSLVIRSELRAAGYSSLPSGTWTAILSLASLCILSGAVMLWRLRGSDFDLPKTRRTLVLASLLFGIGVTWLLIGAIDLASLLRFRPLQ